MSKVSYKNEAAVLSFDYQDVVDTLAGQINEYNVEDDSLLLRWLEENSKYGERDLEIDSDDDRENDNHINRVVYVIRDLLLADKGDVYCKKCGRYISETEIKKDQTSPLDYYKDISKKTIKELKKERGIKGRVRLPGGSGGTTFYCGEGHELFSTKDWVI